MTPAPARWAPKHRLASAIVATALVLIPLLSCGTGARPTLIDPATEIDRSPLELDLPPAPADVADIAPASPDRPVESSVDDALLSWSLERNINYVDACDRVTTTTGALCDVTTERELVRLVGPSADDLWYIVTLDKQFDESTGVGYRVAAVEIIGR